jgi:uncharacterized protein (TIGR02449 family)
MISDFQDLSEKIDRLAAITLSLRHDNTQLRQGNKTLAEQNAELVQRLTEAQHRVEALLALLPGSEQDDAAEPVEAAE